MANQIQPSIGRIVHYVDIKGVTQAAMITRVWTRDCVNLRVFADAADSYFATSVVYNDEKSQYSWAWPERV